VKTGTPNIVGRLVPNQNTTINKLSRKKTHAEPAETAEAKDSDFALPEKVSITNLSVPPCDTKNRSSAARSALFASAI